MHQVFQYPQFCTILRENGLFEELLTPQHSTGPLYDPVTWHGINYTGTQITQWDFQKKESRAGLVRVPLFWKSVFRLQ